MRYSGAALGLALSNPPQPESRTESTKLMSVILGLLIGKGSQYIHQFLIPRSDMLVFYFSEYCLNFVTVTMLTSLCNI